MRILVFNHNVARSGGTYWRAFHFGRELAARGHDVTLVTISPANRFIPSVSWTDGLCILESPDLLWGIGRTGWDPWDTFFRMGIGVVRGVDLVHAFDCRPAVIMPALAAARCHDVPLVIDWADWWGRGGTISERPYRIAEAMFGGIETFFEESFRTQACATTVISRALAQRALGLGVPSCSIFRIPQGCDVEGVRPHDKASARQSLGIDSSGPVVGHLGVVLRRDADLLFEAVRQAAREVPDFQLVMIGNHKAVVPEDLRALGIVSETGFVPDSRLTEWLGACDALLLPLTDSIASWGRWPSKGNAYLSAGRPIVATGVSDLAEILAFADVGTVTMPDSNNFARGMIDVMTRSSAHQRWGERARAIAEGPLRWERLTDHLESVYAFASRGTTASVARASEATGAFVGKHAGSRTGGG